MLMRADPCIFLRIIAFIFLEALADIFYSVFIFATAIALVLYIFPIPADIAPII